MCSYIQGGLLIITLISNTQTSTTVDKLKTNASLYNDSNAINKTLNQIKKIQNATKEPTKEWKFEDYMKKFEPATIWEQIDKQKKYNGLVLTDEEQSEIMFQGMDPTDELMELKIENGDPKIILENDARRGWKPPRGASRYKRDRFYLRRRMYELMKQAIYQTRNKMVVMQVQRDKYSNSSLYKMGFLMNKADNAAKTFGKFSFRAFRGCLLSREKVSYRMPLFDLLTTNERQLSLWFSVEILADLIKKNDEICKAIFKNQTERRIETFDERFIN
ncbi:hypothetical protein B5X24_HaOG217186 [Helicoverpa armigera]|uniref:Uncharacterized protein n=2 Tax=Helicoverpa armigera TaxID=29058 RepID=A0A2W1BUK2_HELAM|nr:hypothetical protein B5X24_HaOG217186 [Helicoverpa armigera]